HKSNLTLHAEAAYNALADCGLTTKDVDAVLSTYNVPQLGEYMGIVPTYADGTMFGGCSYMMHVQHAAAAIQAGICEVALVTHGESGRSRVGFRWGGGNPQSPEGQFERPYGTFTAVVETTAERATDLKQKPVYLVGSGEATAHGMISMMKDFTYAEASRRAGEKAFKMAGVTPKDIQHAMFYDAFTFTPMLMLEDL